MATEGHLSRRQLLGAGLAGAASLLGVSAQAVAEPVWIDQRRLGPFLCRAAFPLDQRLLSDADLSHLELELRRVLALSPCTEEIEVMLLANAKQHRQLIASRHPEAPYRRALFYKQNKRSIIYAYRHGELAIDLRHECTHALLHADLPMVPLWLDEGLAEYFEPRAADRAAGPSHLGKLLKELRQGRVMPLSELEGKHDLAEMSEVDYRFSWAWTHFLLHGSTTASMQLWSTLAALRRYEPPALMSERLTRALGSPEQAFVSHFQAWPGVLQAARRRAVMGR